MKNILFVVLAFVSIETGAQSKRPKKPFEPSAFSKDIRLGYLAGKIKLTDSILSVLENYRVEGYFFALLRDTGARIAPLRIEKYEKEFQKAEDSTKVGKDRLKGHCFVESYGDTAAHNDQSGADGPQQFMWATGKSYYLVGDDFDYRRDPERSFCAAGQYLADMSYIFGSGPEDSIAMGFASAGYHMGEPNLFETIGLAVAQMTRAKVSPKINSRNARNYIEKYNLSWRKIYFMAVPGTALYTKLSSLKDHSAGYYFRVRAGERLLSFFETDYDRLYKMTRDGVPDSVKKVPALFISWYPPERSDSSGRAGTTDSTRFKEETDSALAQGFVILLNGLFRKIAKGSFRPMKVKEFSGPFIKVDFFDGKNEELFEFMLERLYGFGFLSYLKTKEEKQYLIALPPGEKERQLLRQTLEEANEYKSRK